MTIRGMAVWWNDDEGFGVVRSDDAPGEVWAHFSILDMEDYRSLVPGQPVEVDYEAIEQDGYHWRAGWVRPLASEPQEESA
ncbi:MAG: cold shock domain-containing protein [Acidimicrobiales bacterium]